MSQPAPARERPDYFKNTVIVIMTLISVFGALVTVLQNHASLRSSDLAQRSSFNAVNASGLYFRAGLEAAHGTDVLQRYDDYVQRSVRADTKARALQMGGQPELAAEYRRQAERWRTAAGEVAQADPLLTQYGQDTNRYREDLSREAYVEEEREHTLLDQSRTWSNKANSYVAVLSTLSVALFLSGLSLTLGSRLRVLLIASGAGLAALCTLWVLVILLTPVPEISEDAIQAFVDGRVKYNVALANDEDLNAARRDFNDALDLAPDYGRAYFYRSLTHTDLSVLTRTGDTQQGIDDALAAIRLGNASTPVLGNLGWLYYLNGQYNSALEYTSEALANSPQDCYLAFNRGLILMALQRPDEANPAYDQAVDCALRQSSEARFRQDLDTGVQDLNELAEIRPDLGDSLEPAIIRLKEALASVILYGDVMDHGVQAEFGAVTFGSSVDADNIVQDVATQFAQNARVIYAQLPYANMKSDSRWMTRWLLNGTEYLTTTYNSWDYGEAGTAWVSVFNNGGLNSGTYELDVFVDGRLVTRGTAVVQRGLLPPMFYYQSTSVGVTLVYPLAWNVTDLADNEVSVVAAREADTETFFGVTAWVADTGTDDDVFELFDLYLDVLEKGSQGFTKEDREPFLVAERDGWLQYYSYTNSAGQPIEGALAGVLNDVKSLSYVAIIESHSDDWAAQEDIFNAMLERLTIDE
jgi:tetratricopeptide (TPR) repeat protein